MAVPAVLVAPALDEREQAACLLLRNIVTPPLKALHGRTFKRMDFYTSKILFDACCAVGYNFVHCNKRRVALTRLWSPWLHLSVSSTVVIKEWVHSHRGCVASLLMFHNNYLRDLA